MNPLASILKGWFAIRRDLSAPRRVFLTAISFVLPLSTWCLVSYVDWIWHPDIKLQISSEREGNSTIFTAGDHISPSYYKEMVAATRAENTQLLAAATPPKSTKRANQKLLRQLAPIGIAQDWLPYTDAQNDAAIYHLWRDIATGAKVPVDPALSAENLEIVKKNWAQLAPLSANFSLSSLPETPLLKLIPQGLPANPVFLPAPHEVWHSGWRDFTSPAPAGELTMRQRYQHSLRVILFGFFWSCVIGVPIGVLCGVFDFFSKLFEPFVDFSRYMPAPTFSTLLVAVLLAGDAPKIALVFIGTVFQMILVVSKTTRLLDPALLEAAQTLGASPKQMITRVVIPGILPNLYNDLRILLGWAWTWLVIAELIGVKSGLTEFIETQGRFRNFDRVFPVIILIGVTGFVTDQVLSWFHGIIFPWTSRGNAFSQAFARLFAPPRRVAAKTVIPEGSLT